MNNKNKALEKDLFLLKKVVEILRQLRIPFWLDQGSLLGIVREGEFLPWDNDIDLSVWATSIEQHIPEIVRKMRCLGAKVDVRYHKIKISYGAWRNIGRPIELKFYHAKSNDAYALLMPIRSQHICMRLAHRGVLYPATAIKCCAHALINISTKHYPGSSLLYTIGTTIYDIASNLPGYFITRSVVFCCPIKYIESLIECTIYDDILVYIPKYSEDYLTFKYGKDWRTPKKSWKYWQEDGALLKR